MRLLIPGLGAAAAFFLVPLSALAWGPVAHLDFAGQLLAGVIPLAPVLMDLITKHAADFIYGNLAADVILGKNRARDHEQCHSWEVARKLLVHARLQGPAAEAFMLGYMAHLGADVVKCVYTGSVESFREVVEGCPVPVVIAGGEKVETDRELLEMVAQALEAGAAGVSIGRNAFQHENPSRIVAAIGKMVHEGCPVDEAEKFLRAQQ